MAFSRIVCVCAGPEYDGTMTEGRVEDGMTNVPLSSDDSEGRKTKIFASLSLFATVDANYSNVYIIRKAPKIELM